MIHALAPTPSGEEVGTAILLLLALVALVFYNNRPKGPRES